MALYSTTYPNTIRTISGSAVAFADDVILLCDTSVGAVTLTLQEIPNNNWNLLWKLFVIDNSNNASVNNITINAPSGQTINLGSSIVINTNGGGYVFEIGGNGKYLATPSSGGGGGGGGVSSVSVTSPITNSGSPTAPNIGISAANGSTNGYLSSTDWNAFNSKGASIAIINGVGTTITTALTSLTFNTQFTLSNVAGAVSASLTKNFPDVSKNSVGIVLDTDNINFNNHFNITASLTPNKANIAIQDSGWINLLGFEHQASVTTIERPQCRVMGNVMYFKGTAIVPLASDLAGTTYVAPSSTTYAYLSDPYPYVFQGSSGSVKGCLIAGIINKSIEFNLGASVIPTSSNYSVGGKTNTGWKLYNRGVETTPTRGTLLTTMGKLEMDTGILRFYPYNYDETTWTNDPGCIGTGRLMTAMVNSGEFALDWTEIDNNPTIGGSVSATHSTGTTGVYSGFYPEKRSPISYTYPFTVESAKADNLGGFMLELDGLIAFPP